MAENRFQQAARQYVLVIAAVLAGIVAMPGLLSAAQCSGASRQPVSQREASLSRQISAIRELQARRSCMPGMDGGFACRELQMRLNSAARDLAAETRSALNARSGNCAANTATLEAARETPKQPRVHRETASRAGPNLVTMCVRLSDGYYFPSPNSGYMSRKDEPAILAQCQLICDTPDMDVYRLTGIDQTDDNMTSLKTGKAYADLAKANAFRQDPAHPRCDMTRYYRLANSTPAAEPLPSAPQVASDPTSSVTTVTLVPATAPAAQVAALAKPAADTLDVANWSLRGSTAEVRHVRMVGPAYLSDN